jgi:hypothetical protein
MNGRSGRIAGPALWLMAGLVSMAMAQDIPAARNRNIRSSFGFIATLEKRVGLTPEQRDAVRGLLAQQRQQSQALREQTDEKIRGLLHSEQQKKFDAVIAELKARRGARQPGA